MTDEDERQSSRRGFFRMGFDDIRQGALDAAREVVRAVGEVSDAMDISDDDPPPYHRVRLRGSHGATARPFVRPPGALPEPQFLTTCERCRACAEACPEDAIFPAGPQHGALVEMTPMLALDQRACVLCVEVPCAAACPTGALLPIAPSAIRIGVAESLSALCLNTLGEECDACVDACPFPGEALWAGDDKVPVIGTVACTGCGQCVVACRAYPKALVVHPL